MLSWLGRVSRLLVDGLQELRAKSLSLVGRKDQHLRDPGSSHVCLLSIGVILVDGQVAHDGVLAVAGPSSLLKHQEDPPVVVVNVDEGGGVNVEENPGLEPLVVVPEPRGGLQALEDLVAAAFHADGVHQLPHRSEIVILRMKIKSCREPT